MDDVVAHAKVFKVRRRTATKVGACASQPGIQRVGRGTILLAGHEAAEMVSILGATIRKLQDRDQSDPKTIIALWRLQLLFNQVLLDSGRVLLSE